MSLIVQPTSTTYDLDGKHLEAGLQRLERNHPSLGPTAFWLPPLNSLGQKSDLAGRRVVCF